MSKQLRKVFVGYEDERHSWWRMDRARVGGQTGIEKDRSPRGRCSHSYPSLLGGQSCESGKDSGSRFLPPLFLLTYLDANLGLWPEACYRPP